MAYVQLSVPIQAIRGTVGDVTYRRYNGRTIATKKPDMGKDDPTKPQLVNRNRFALAAAYGRVALADPEIGPLYEAAAKKRCMAVYAVITQDCCRPPEIDRIILSEYNGAPGDVIEIYARDDFQVAGVTVSIQTADGRELERGDAVGDVYLWCYTATAAAQVESGVRIVVTAWDLPGNTAHAEVPASLDMWDSLAASAAVDLEAREGDLGGNGRDNDLDRNVRGGGAARRDGNEMVALPEVGEIVVVPHVGAIDVAEQPDAAAGETGQAGVVCIGEAQVVPSATSEAVEGVEPTPSPVAEKLDELAEATGEQVEVVSGPAHEARAGTGGRSGVQAGMSALDADSASRGVAGGSAQRFAGRPSRPPRYRAHDGSSYYAESTPECGTEGNDNRL